MRTIMLAAAVGTAALSSAAYGEAHTEQCFDKDTLTYVDCPQAPAPVVAPAPVIAPPPVYDWTGFYIGAHAGYGYGENNIDLAPTQDAFSGLVFASRFLPTSLDNDDLDGFIGGAQAGYNFQQDRVVLGVEADIAYTDMSDTASFSRTGGLILNPAATFTTTETTEVNWLSTVRGRLGFAVLPELLVFGTGGVAIAEVERRGTSGQLGASTFAYSDTDTRIGFTVGGGVEYGVTENISIRADYLYTHLGSEKNTAAAQGAGAVGQAPNGLFGDRDDLSIHAGRIGVNFRF